MNPGHTLEIPGGPRRAIDARFQPQGRLIAFSELNPSDISTDVPRLIVFRDTGTWKLDGATILATGNASSWIRELFFSPDGSLLATVPCHNGDCDHGETTRLWDVHTRTAIGPPLQGRGLGFSADGRRLVLFDDQAEDSSSSTT